MVRAFFIVVAAFSSALAFGQRTMTVHVPAGDVVAFATKGPATGPPLDPVEPKDGVATVSLDGGKDTVYVWDRAVNRSTSAPAKGTDWSPTVDSLKNLAQVVVQVRSGADKVAAANLSLVDGRRTHEAFLDPGQNGDATFFDVNPGPLKVTVRYKANGQDAEPVTQVFTAKDDGEEVPRFTVAVSGKVETVGAPAVGSSKTGTKPGEPAAEAAPKSEGGSSSGVVGLLFALVVGGAVAGGAWYFLRKNPDAVGGTLERLGAQIPKPGDAPLQDPPVAPAPAAAPPEPPQKIVLDPAPDPIQMTDPIKMPVPVAVSVSEPSLVSEAGIPIPLAEGETVVGREVGLGLSLAGESTVSRRHATLVRQGGAVTVQDAGSTNGTFVNGSPAASATPLRPGDSVQFGSVRFRYEG